MLRETDGCGVEWSWIRISHHGHWTLKQHSSAWPPPGHPSLSPPWAGAGTICWNHRDRAKRLPSQHLFTAVQTCKLCETPYWHLMLQQFTLSVEYKGGPESFKNLTVQIHEVWPGRPGSGQVCFDGWYCGAALSFSNHSVCFGKIFSINNNCDWRRTMPHHSISHQNTPDQTLVPWPPWPNLTYLYCIINECNEITVLLKS